MKRILLFRHAKAVADDVMSDDHARPLMAEGREAAQQMGSFLAREGKIPQLILCSTAVRTRETLEQAEPFWMDTPHETRLMAEIYLAPPLRLLDIIRSTDDQLESLMLIGHNPGVHMLTLELGSHRPNQYYHEAARVFPTAAVAELSFSTNHWADLDADSGEILCFASPKTLV